MVYLLYCRDIRISGGNNRKGVKSPCTEKNFIIRQESEINLPYGKEYIYGILRKAQ